MATMKLQSYTKLYNRNFRVNERALFSTGVVSGHATRKSEIGMRVQFNVVNEEGTMLRGWIKDPA